ncbi:putative Zn(II)2Cys6 transcription factor [Aspergillus brunneoviolaceus CBS 621.78]|uniref:Zn(II)2Cys6 transcription factor n=1 Tax=Aspergillus brunneoviolaceus CBS 621.78 TaxID=1450534 RepID=A0ACD1GBJ5_9EURO|nr:putative Zn(II)2Cys6 transcription factor [Aspergillus brunneoviolaceus CBS 621.78]RAH46629.1 putative Zn(II)2Cys6 transcription factor [Aspergillus brunneoviolaceus CBS 621.78]
MSAALDESAAKRRKVRKGTHCCRECRRRKVKCTFAAPDDDSCISCGRRGTNCVSQFALQSPDLVLTPGLSPHSDHARTATQTTRHSKITQALLRALPSSREVEILLGKVSRLSTLCYQSGFKLKSSSLQNLPLEQIVIPSLQHPEAHPVLLARQMLLLAAALQHISPTEVISGLDQHHHVIMEELAESAIAMVTTNDRLMGTLEGLENIILEGFFHIDSGNIRRAWLAIRRAANTAQLLGLHQPGHYRFKKTNDKNDLDPNVMWICIISVERVLSLLLGLPTSTVGTSPTTSGSKNSSQTSGNLSSLIMQITVRILERNQVRVPQQAQGMTRDIDRELIRMTEQLPSSFWQPLAFAGLEVDSVEAFCETRRAWDHMCYYTVVNQLHLPYMLCQSQTADVVYSGIACANASREILTREIAIRTLNPITACCRIGDFMALIAGMTLILAHLASHGQTEVNRLLAHQRSSDRATVERALECMQSMSELHEDVLAAECAALLKDLLFIEARAARGYKTDAGETQVPYLGAIRIAPEGITSVPYSKTGQDQGHHAGVTIGGIGSIQIEPSTVPGQSSVNSTSYVPPQGARTQAPSDSLPQQHTTQLLPGRIPDEVTEKDHMFPDAAASIDDWVFQGFDTAFFDVLMRGAEDAQFDDGRID